MAVTAAVAKELLVVFGGDPPTCELMEWCMDCIEGDEKKSLAGGAPGVAMGIAPEVGGRIGLEESSVEKGGGGRGEWDSWK